MTLEGAPTGEPVDDGTLVVRRRASASAPASVTDDELDATRVTGRTGHGSSEDDAQTGEDVDADTGSTRIVRRESRRRAEAAARVIDDLDLTVAGTGARPVAATVAADVPAPLGRLAQASPPDTVVYERRAEGPAVASRAPVPHHVPQEYVDTAAAQAASRRRSRRRALVVVGIAVAVVVVAVAAILLLAFTG